jgi:putative hemolysin
MALSSYCLSDGGAVYITTQGVPTQRGILVEESDETKTSRARSGLVRCYSPDGRQIRLCELR